MREHVFRVDRCAAAADGADRLHGRAGAGRPDRAQQPARHLHQFRQSARSLRPRAAGRDAPGWRAVRRDAAGARRPRCDAGVDRPGVPRRHRPAARRARQAAAAARRHCRRRRRTARSRSRSSARIFPACRSTASCKALGGRLLEATTTSADYRLYALPERTPPKPGLLRVAEGQGAAIELEIWALPADGFGRFVAAVPPPLSIGTIRLADGRGGSGVPGRGAGHRGRARHFELRRLARL